MLDPQDFTEGEPSNTWIIYALTSTSFIARRSQEHAAHASVMTAVGRVVLPVRFDAHDAVSMWHARRIME